MVWLENTGLEKTGVGGGLLEYWILVGSAVMGRGETKGKGGKRVEERWVLYGRLGDVVSSSRAWVLIPALSTSPFRGRGESICATRQRHAVVASNVEDAR